MMFVRLFSVGLACAGLLATTARIATAQARWEPFDNWILSAIVDPQSNGDVILFAEAETKFASTGRITRPIVVDLSAFDHSHILDSALTPAGFLKTLQGTAGPITPRWMLPPGRQGPRPPEFVDFTLSHGKILTKDIDGVIVPARDEKVVEVDRAVARRNQVVLRLSGDELDDTRIRYRYENDGAVPLFASVYYKDKDGIWQVYANSEANPYIVRAGTSGVDTHQSALLQKHAVGGKYSCKVVLWRQSPADVIDESPVFHFDKGN